MGAFVFSSIVLELPVGFWVVASLLAFLGLLSDKVEISPKLRLAVQFFGAIIFIYITHRFSANTVKGLLLFAFFIIYIVGTANYYNFMDGINGIAGVTGIIGFSLLGVYGIYTDQNPKWIALSFIMVFSCIGFLPFNMPEAKVFMGDVGSILLGFVFGCIVLSFSSTVSDFIILAGFMFPFYVDELVTMVERIIDRQRLTLPHRRHFYQVLANQCKIDHWKVSVGYGFFQLVVGLSVWGGLKLNIIFGFVVMGLFAGAFVLVNNKVKKRYLR